MNAFLTCPDCDDNFSLGVIDVDQDCTLYDQKFSQVCGIVFLPDTVALPSDWTDVDSWAEVLDNSVAGTKGKYLVGEGEIDAPNEERSDYPKRRQRVTSRLYTLDMTVKNLNATQYEFLRQMQCGYTGFRFWIETVGGRLFGGANGIDPDLVTVAFVYSGGRNDKEQAILTIEYEADGDPTRADVSGLGDTVAEIVPMVTAFGPVAGDPVVDDLEIFGPVAGDPDISDLEAFGY